MAITVCDLIISFHILYDNKLKIWPFPEGQNKVHQNNVIKDNTMQTALMKKKKFYHHVSRVI